MGCSLLLIASVLWFAAIGMQGPKFFKPSKNTKKIRHKTEELDKTCVIITKKKRIPVTVDTCSGCDGIKGLKEVRELVVQTGMHTCCKSQR